MNVSIIVPVYNVAPYIEDCLTSVMRQTYTGNIECLIVDDCGSDDSINIAERLITRYSGSIQFKIFHHNHNLGLSAARNTGTQNALGEWLYYLDSDDKITEDCIEKLMALVVKHPGLEMVQGNALRHLSSKKSEIQIKEIHLAYATSNKECRKCLYEWRHMTLAVWNKLIKRDFIIANNLLCKVGIVSEDYLWSFILAKHLERAFFIDDITYHYKMRPDSIVASAPRRVKATSFSVIFNEIFTNLTSGQEKEEFCYFANNFGYAYTRYVHDEPSFQNLYKMCWDKSQAYEGKVFRLKLCLCKLLGLSKYGWIACVFINILQHPVITFRRIQRHLR